MRPDATIIYRGVDSFKGAGSRRLKEIADDERIMKAGRESLRRHKSLDPHTWLAESREHALALVYTTEVLGPVRAVSEGLVVDVPKIRLPEDYLKRAGAFARVRAAEAAFRLAGVWRLVLK